MKPIVETVRISKQGRDQLIKLKRQSGIENWNILCRWALLVSLSKEKSPIYSNYQSEGGIEMTWKTFAGDFSHEISSLIKFRVFVDGKKLNNDNYTKCFKQHLHRGLGFLSSGKEKKDIHSLIKKNIYII